LESQQKRTLERLAIVAIVIVLVIVLAYLAYKPNSSTTPGSPVQAKTPITSDHLPILRQHKAASLALFRSGRWLIKANANGIWDDSTDGDVDFTFGNGGDTPLGGFWEGCSAPSVGVFREGTFSLLIEGQVKTFAFGDPGDIPVLGDWNGDGHTKIGTFNKGVWRLDMKGDGHRADRSITLGGNPDEVPIVGDWNGDGRSKVGIFNSGAFSLDFDGNGIFDKSDKTYYFGGKGEIPVVGDWNGDGRSKVGVYQKGFWVIDFDGNGKWENPNQVDRLIALGGVAGEIPLLGDWNGDGRMKAGIYQKPNTFSLDFDGNGVWETKDKLFSFGVLNDIPVVLNPVHVKK
jgi:hypothetical protein